MASQDLSREFLADGPVGDDRPADEDVSPRSVALKLALFGVLFLGTLAALYYASERIEPVYSINMDRALLVNEEGSRFEAISVGPSHTSSVDFYALGLDGLHLWRGGMDYFQASYILQTVADRMPNVKFVFLPASMASYGDNLAAPIGEERRLETYVFGQRVRGLTYFRPLRDDFETVQFDWKTMLQARFWPISRPDSWEGVIDKLRDPSNTNYVRTTNGTRFYLERLRPERLTADSIAANGLEVATARIQKRAELMEVRPDVCEIGETLMNRIADTLGPDVVTVFFTHTSHPAYVDHMEDFNNRPGSNVECTPAYYASVMDRERDNVVYVDLRYYEELSSQPVKHYKNGDHLNRVGGHLFSTRMREIVAERLQEKLPSGHPTRELFLSRRSYPLPPRKQAEQDVWEDPLVGIGLRGEDARN
ncbi:MAG: hypothetical protein AAGI91_15520 [Bacteroidota bacterium]